MAVSKSFMTTAFENAGLKPWPKYIDYIRRAHDEGAADLRPFLDVYDSMKKRDAITKTPEELCDMSGVAPRTIWMHVSAQLWDLGHAEADMLLAVNHAKIVGVAVKQAKTATGIKDRENLMKAGGVIPIPHNQSVHFHKHLSGSAEQKAAPALLPSFEADMDEVNDDLPQLPPGR